MKSKKRLVLAYGFGFFSAVLLVAVTPAEKVFGKLFGKDVEPKILSYQDDISCTESVVSDSENRNKSFFVNCAGFFDD